MSDNSRKAYCNNYFSNLNDISFRVSEVAGITGFTPTHIRRLIHQGKLKAFHDHCGLYAVALNDLDKYIDDHEIRIQKYPKWYLDCIRNNK